MNFYELVYEAVRRIPAGKAASYGQIALLCGNPRASRAVGTALRQCGRRDVPCHRVVNRRGELAPAFPGQRSLLESEGVLLDADGRVDLKIYGWFG